MELNDKVLFDQLKNGSSNAFEQLYIAYKEPALRFSFSLIKDMDEARSLVQEVFMQLWIKRKKLNTEASFQAYLFSCLRNKVYDHIKSIKKSESAIDDLWHKTNMLQSCREEPDNSKQLETLIKVVETLPKSRKSILKLRYECGKSYKEIAEQLDISSNTVKNQLIKAKEYLRAHVDISFVICLCMPFIF